MDIIYQESAAFLVLQAVSAAIPYAFHALLVIINLETLVNPALQTVNYVIPAQFALHA